MNTARDVQKDKNMEKETTKKGHRENQGQRDKLDFGLG